MTSYQQNRIASRANSMGLSSQDLARHSGRGAELKARIEAVRGQTSNLHNTPALSASFIKDVEVRLDELDQAVRNAERLDTEQQRLAYVAIERELDEVTGEIQQKSSR